MMLQQALLQRADAICLGFRPETADDPEYQRSRDQLNHVLNQVLNQVSVSDSAKLDPAKPALNLHSDVRGPTGECGIPISMRVNGHLRYYATIPFSFYGFLLNAIQLRPTVIGDSPDNPGPARYIEIFDQLARHLAIQVAGISVPSGKRRFVGVDFEFQSDNTFWIHVGKARWVDTTTRVSDRIF